jgi:hypothetical protein
MINIDNAHKEVNDTYKQLIPMVDEVVSKNSKEIDAIFNKIKSNLTNLTNKELQDYMLQLTVEAYYLTNIKDSSTLKQECALTLLKSGQAEIYNGTVGTQSARSNQAIIDTLDKQVVNVLYNAITNRFKSKLDEIHRMINVLSNVLISKNAEAKLRGGVKEDDSHSNDY